MKNKAFYASLSTYFLYPKKSNNAGKLASFSGYNGNSEIASKIH